MNKLQEIRSSDFKTLYDYAIIRNIALEENMKTNQWNRKCSNKWTHDINFYKVIKQFITEKRDFLVVAIYKKS